MTTQENPLLIPRDHPKDTAKGKLYAKRDTKRGFRHKQMLTLDTATTTVLIAAQTLDNLSCDGQPFSRTVLIRRAVQMYAKQLLRAAQVGNDPFISTEYGLLLSMSAPLKRKALRLYSGK